MILSLLERLEQEGGGSAAAAGLAPGLAPGWRTCGLGADLRGASGDGHSSRWVDGNRGLARWYRGGSGASSTTSGRLSAASTLTAERTDDGVLVAAPSTGARERIVWVGDLELDCSTEPAATFRLPSFDFHDDGLGLNLTWPFRPPPASTGIGEAVEFRLRLTLPCRPAGELTFRNDELDSEVWLSATRDGRMAARMRPYAALPELEIVPRVGTMDFQPDPDWRLGVEVAGVDGTLQVEDRFSPGSFSLRLPVEEGSIQLSIRVVAGNAAERGRRRGALGELMGRFDADARPASQPAVASTASAAPPARNADELRLDALALPGLLLDRGATSLESESELRDLLIAAAPHVRGPRIDVALWAARAAYLITPEPTADVTSVTLPFLRGLVERAEQDQRSSGCPGAAAAGLPRVSSGSVEADSGCIPIEHASLLHQACQHAADLAAAANDQPFERRARRLARQIRRWFQSEYWLARPDRAADLAFLGSANHARWDRIRALCLRPHMLLAASFEGAPLTTAQRRLIVRAVEARLLVPELGVATLDCDDIEFDGHAAENGAIWPFLLGPFVEASLRAFGPDRGRHRMLSQLLNSRVLEDAPMAWAHSAGRSTSAAPYRDMEPIHSHRQPMPIGPLQFSLNAAELARARCLLGGALPDASLRDGSRGSHVFAACGTPHPSAS